MKGLPSTPKHQKKPFFILGAGPESGSESSKVNADQECPPQSMCQASSSAASTPTIRQKLGFKDRPWSEIEKLWRSKIREPPGPNIEELIKLNHHSNQERNGNYSESVSKMNSAHSLKAKPSSETNFHRHYNITAQEPDESNNAYLLHTAERDPCMHTWGQSQSPSTTKKAVELMSPKVFQTWNYQRWTVMADRSRHDRNCVKVERDTESEGLKIGSSERKIQAGDNVDSRPDHFEELLREW